MQTIAYLSGFFAGALSFFSFVFYYISILRKKTTPNRATWLILTIVGCLIFFSYYSLGAKDTLWLPLSYVFGPLIVCILAIKYGEKGWTNFDKLCLFAAGVSLFFWWLSGSALITLLINIFIDFLGILPTVKKSYERPSSEEVFPWLITFLSCFVNIFAINTWSFDIWVYPIYMIGINGVIFFLLFFPGIRITRRV